jgi:hypothetical protein
MSMPAPPPDADRVRGYILAQAAKLSLPELVEKVRTDSLQVREAAESVPAERFRERPAEGDWSAAEVWTHVLQMSEHGAASITGILDSGTKPAAISDTISGETRAGLDNAAAYWEAFEASRAPLYERVLAADGTEHLEVKLTHPWFGELSWREWFLFMRVHDLDHTRQLQAIGEAFRG